MSEPRPSILIAEDIQSNVELVYKLLSADYEIRVATQGQEALDLALEHPPDLILLDVMMPVLNGFDVCVRLKANPRTRHIPVLFLTALSDVEALLRGFQAGGQDYVSKPFRPEELRARVATHLALKMAHDRERNLRLQLESALAEVKILSGLLPICAYCKKIRDDQGSWIHLETYISTHSEADFTHGICPDCKDDFRKG